MKKSNIEQSIAAVAALAGAFTLVTGLMPFINPGFVEVSEPSEYSPRMLFLIPTLLSLPILGLAWHFNKKAEATKKEEEKARAVAEPTSQGKL